MPKAVQEDTGEPTGRPGAGERKSAKGIPLKCYRIFKDGERAGDSCGREWTYKGKNAYIASCPECKTSVKIDTARQDK